MEGYHTLSALFGGRVHPVTGQRTDHTGIDIPAPEGTPVLAAASGTVEAAGWDGEGRLGDRVILAHGGGWTTTYGQLSQITAVTGETVEQGEVIGYVGATGRATGPHLHLELAENGVHHGPGGRLSGPGAVCDRQVTGGSSFPKRRKKPPAAGSSRRRGSSYAISWLVSRDCLMSHSFWDRST